MRKHPGATIRTKVVVANNGPRGQQVLRVKIYRVFSLPGRQQTTADEFEAALPFKRLRVGGAFVVSTDGAEIDYHGRPRSLLGRINQATYRQRLRTGHRFKAATVQDGIAVRREA